MLPWRWLLNGGDWKGRAQQIEDVVLALANRYSTPTHYFLDKPLTWLFDHLLSLKARRHEQSKQ